MVTPQSTRQIMTDDTMDVGEVIRVAVEHGPQAIQTVGEYVQAGVKRARRVYTQMFPSQSQAVHVPWQSAPGGYAGYRVKRRRYVRRAMPMRRPVRRTRRVYRRRYYSRRK